MEMGAFALTFKAFLASTPVPIHQVVTSPSILAWIREAFIFVHFTVDANPACITEALVSERWHYLLWQVNVQLSHSSNTGLGEETRDRGAHFCSSRDLYADRRGHGMNHVGPSGVLRKQTSLVLPWFIKMLEKLIHYRELSYAKSGCWYNIVG